MNTSSEQINAVFTAQKQFSTELRNSTVKQRIKKLENLEKAILDYKEEIKSALSKDFAKPEAETVISEIMPVLAEIRHTSSHLKSWMKPRYVKAPLMMKGTKSRIETEPKGCVLIISPFNYPFSLALGPLISAVAAGNTVILKPSEFTPHTSALLKKLIKQTFSDQEIWVCEGEVETAQSLLKKPFNHIFFTGSPAVGKKVMEAASKNLSDITLELGGKSPVIIDESVDIQEAAERIAWGKCINAGQTCVAPDYILVAQRKQKEFISAWEKAIHKFYGDAPEKSNDLAAIINSNHYDRILDLIKDAENKGAKKYAVGDPDDETRKIPPTLLTNLSDNATVLEEEIFGPVLPVIPYGTLEEAVDIVNSYPKPLAVYIYSKNQKQADWIISQTSAGTTVINHNILQFSHSNLPFGGVNNSGIGKAHGEYGFKAFSNERAILEYTSPVNLLKFVFPPYDSTKDTVLKWMSKFA